MKRILGLFILVVSLLFLTACGKADIKILMPGEYIDGLLVRAFEKEYGKKVKIVTFESNEAALTKARSEKYDLYLPSDYMIEQMIKEDMLQKIDWTKVPNLNRETSFPDELQTLLDVYEEEFPLLDYAVPYFWGNLGIVYNKETVSLETLEAAQWDIFKNTSLNMVMYDSSRDGFFVALKSLGYSANTDNETELLAAENWLKDMTKTARITFLTDEILDDMLVPRYDLSLTYSGDAVYLMSEQSKLGYFVPTVGSNVFVDAFAIPKEVNDLDAVYDFINFMSRYDSAKQNTLEIMYQSTRKDVYNEMLSEGSDLYEFKDAYRVIMHPEDELFRYVPANKRFIDDSWATIRASN
ncbi:MAG: ABC transporter substrate-binding protein [Acholeplasmatales bacterium]